MYKDYRYINAGENEIYRYGRKAVEKVSKSLEANDFGYYSIPVDGGKYWTIGTCTSKNGEFCKINDTIFSVNKGGYAFAKAGTEKGEAFVKAIQDMVSKMNELNAARFTEED